MLDILSKYRVPKVVNIKFRYFKSMPSMIVKFKEEVGAAFTYYHFHQFSYLYLKVLGRRTEVFRMLNEVEATSKRIILVIREISEFVVHD